MDKRKLAEICSIKVEIEQLKEISSKPGEYVGDTAMDYRTGKGRPIIIQGYSQEKQIKARKKMLVKIKKLEDMVAEFEKWIDSIDDSQIRVIFRYRYIDGMTWEEIGDKINYHRTRVAQIHDEFLRKGEDNQ